MMFTDFPLLALAAIFVQWIHTIFAIVIEGIMGKTPAK